PRLAGAVPHQGRLTGPGRGQPAQRRLAPATQQGQRLRVEREAPQTRERLADWDEGQLGHGGQRRRRTGVAHLERPHRRAPQLIEVCDRAERTPEVRGEYAYVRPLRALDAELDAIPVARDELEAGDLALARPPPHRDPPPAAL